ncbi:MAG: histidine phosphatase family protein [Acidimicrobiales bacterium]
MTKKQRPQRPRRVLLVRHAQAKSRSSWQHDDFERPLSEQGLRQANEIADRLSSELVAKVISSRAERCVATVAPLAERLGRDVELVDYLAEGSDGIESLDLLLGAAEEIDEMATLVACSHGDICSEIVSGLADSGLLDGKLSEVKKGGAIALYIEDGSVASGAVLTPDALIS